MLFCNHSVIEIFIFSVFFSVKDVINGSNLLNAMDILKGMLITPIKPMPSDDDCGTRQLPPVDDIPAQFTKVLGKGIHIHIYLGIRM